MSAQISLNPMATTNAKGLFSTNSNGLPKVMHKTIQQLSLR